MMLCWTGEYRIYKWTLETEWSLQSFKLTMRVYQTLGSAGKPSQLRRRNQLLPDVITGTVASNIKNGGTDRMFGKLHDIAKPYAEVQLVLLRGPRAHY